MRSRFTKLLERWRSSPGDAAPKMSASTDVAGATLVGLQEAQDADILLISFHDPATADGGPYVLLVGRKSSRELEVALRRTKGDSWSALLPRAELNVFGREVVDVHVQVRQRTVRLRLSTAGAALPAESVFRRHWYATKDGNLSNRRTADRHLITEAGVFDPQHYRHQLPDPPPDCDLVDHYLAVGAAAGLSPSALFDPAYYVANNPSVSVRGALAHYCAVGWRELRDPSPSFNTWWYWFKHLDPADFRTNPLGHYETIGRHRDLSTTPDRTPSLKFGSGYRVPTDRPLRRLCLFAGYDPAAQVDDYVIEYLSELSNHADVYYFADAEMSTAELSKLSRITRGAWSERHGEYDFGSYARLVEKVGWATIEEYDELLLVNDSCYLLRTLEHVFARMDSRACDWWGLQATKGLYQTRLQPENQTREPVPIDEVRSSLINRYELDYTYDFHIASFFLAYRQPVIRDPEFRRYLGSVRPLTRKRDIVKRYEIGLTHWLLQNGHLFDTFVPMLYPFHPMFSDWYFRMLDDGLPVLKRLFLAENLYRVPGLDKWAERVRTKVPDAPVEMFERNLQRVSDPAKLRISMSVQNPPDALPVDQAD